MSNYNKLSVIIPVYNEAKNIQVILDILDDQSVNGFEVVVIDDGSTDDTVKIIEEYHSNKFKLTLVRQNNMGAAKARENAINTAKGEYIALIDCDDGLSQSSLERAFSSFVDSDVDISLFDLKYTDSLNIPYNSVFNYFSKDKLIEGKRAFENCISSWGLHAFGIYNKKLILAAYSIYHDINKDGYNFLNNDEVISRICFSLANKIYLSDGDYFFVKNTSSTTRRINSNYYKVIFNALYLRDFIVNSYVQAEKQYMIDASYKLIVSTIWGVTVRYIKWRNSLGKEEKNLWQGCIKNTVDTVLKDSKTSKLSLGLKSLVKLYLIKYCV